MKFCRDLVQVKEIKTKNFESCDFTIILQNVKLTTSCAITHVKIFVYFIFASHQTKLYTFLQYVEYVEP